MIVILSDRKTGSAKKLVDYIRDVTHEGKKASDVWSVNCEAGEDYDLAVLEMEATQSLNTRAKSNPTWHLIVSFVEGDLSKEVLRAIEQEISGSLGMGDHQRVCAVHNDTSNLHFHIALNRINPETGRLGNPSFFKRKLQAIGAEIEHKYGLKPTISDAIERGGGQARGYSYGWEKVSGTQSFLGWVKDNCVSDVLGAESWAQAHSLLAVKGVYLAKRGNGLIFQSGDKNYSVKASSVRRDFSFSQLKDRFGSFEEGGERVFGSGYKKGPLKSDTRLWTQYEALASENKAAFKAAVGNLRSERDGARGRIQKWYSQRRSEVKNSSWRGAAKKSEYSVLRYNRISELKEVSDAYVEGVDTAKSDHPYINWHAFLQERSETGDEAARSLLKKMNKPHYSGCRLNGRRNLNFSAFKSFNINRYGDVEYSLPEGQSIVDTGKALILDPKLSDIVVDTGLELALQMFGESISVDNERLRDKIETRIRDEKLSIVLNGVSFDEGKPGVDLGR